MARPTHRPDELRHFVDTILRDTPGVDDHRWIAEAPPSAARSWSALEIDLGTCDAPCVHEIERRLLSVPGVRGLGPHWPRPSDPDRSLYLRLYRGEGEHSARR